MFKIGSILSEISPSKWGIITLELPRYIPKRDIMNFLKNSLYYSMLFVAMVGAVGAHAMQQPGRGKVGTALLECPICLAFDKNTAINRLIASRNIYPPRLITHLKDTSVELLKRCPICANPNNKTGALLEVQDTANGEAHDATNQERVETFFRTKERQIYEAADNIVRYIDSGEAIPPYTPEVLREAHERATMLAGEIGRVDFLVPLLNMRTAAMSDEAVSRLFDIAVGCNDLGVIEALLSNTNTHPNNKITAHALYKAKRYGYHEIKDRLVSYIVANKLPINLEHAKIIRPRPADSDSDLD